MNIYNLSVDRHLILWSRLIKHVSYLAPTASMEQALEEKTFFYIL